MPNIARANVVLALFYIGLTVALCAGALLAGPSLWAMLPLAIVAIPYLAYDIRLGRIKRPCGHMSIRQGGRLGFYTPFLHRGCPICGDRIEDAPPI